MTLLYTPISDRALAQVTTRRRILVRPATELTRMTRYRVGTYSHTVDRIVFTDGSSARTDLIRLNPSLQAYSLDFTGIAPDQPLRYRLESWSALPHPRTRGCEAQVDWILRHSFPVSTTADLSRRVREAGHPLGAANVREHEAIAATQAAIWFFTNGLALDTRPLNVPTVQQSPGPVITFEFEGTPQLGGYSVRSDSAGPVRLRLQKSANGAVWQDVSSSELTTGPGRGRYQRTLGIGSTLSTSNHGQLGRGYRYYRLIAETEGGSGVPRIGHVGFWLSGTRHFRNADRVVHLYNYLVAGALTATGDTDAPGLVDARAAVGPELVGPFRVQSPLTLDAADGRLVDAQGAAVDQTVQPGTDFYLRPAPGTSTTTVTATTPHDLTGRVLTGVASEGGAPHRFTPVALTVFADVAFQFDISWDDHCRTDTLEKPDEHR